MWLLVSARALADCTFETTPADIERMLSDAESAYSSLEEQTFARATTELDFFLPCVEAPLTQAIAARLHRVRGLGRHVAGDVDGAHLSLARGRALEPAYTFPEAMMPEGFELRTWYEQLQPGPPQTRTLPKLRHGSLWIDGVQTRELPVEREIPVIWQQIDEQGSAVVTRYLEPMAPLPDYPGVRRAERTWLAAAALTSSAAAGLYSLAWISRSRLARADDPAQLRPIQVETNALGAASVALTAASVTELTFWLVERGKR